MRALKNLISNLAKFRQMSRVWRYTVSALAFVIVFATTYAMVLPAITVDKDTADEDPAIVLDEAAAEEQAPEPEEVAVEPVQAQEVSEEPLEVQEAEAEDVNEDAAEASEEDVSSDNDSDTPAEDDETTGETVNDEFADADESEIAETDAQTEEVPSYTAAAGKLLFKGSDYEVTVAYGKDANLPKDAELVVTEIVNGGNSAQQAVYDAYYEKSLEQVKKQGADGIAFARYFDIVIMYNGEKLEPEADVDVKISYKHANAPEVAENNELKVMHFVADDEHKIAPEDVQNVVPADEVTARTLTENRDDVKVTTSGEKVDEVTFKTDGFSVYGIVGTETITVEHIDHKGTKYEVTVTYGPEAKIPEGSTLSVTDIEEGTDEYEYALNAVLADKQAKGEGVFLPEFGLAALDISILNPEGEEIEPSAPVQVDIKIKRLANVENINDVASSLEIQHHVETNGGVVVETVFEANTEGSFEQKTDEAVIKSGRVVDPNSVNEKDIVSPEADSEEEISFITDRFSTYTITWNTNRNVVVHYGYLSGGTSGTFVEFDSDPSPVQNTTNYRRHLIYDFTGYQYYRTYFSTNETTTPTSSTRIGPLLRYNNNNWQYRTYTNSGSGSWQNITTSNNTTRHIYVVYEAKKETTGGTATPTSQQTWPEGNDAPQFAKSSTNNGNKTNTIALSIKAAEKPIENSTKANVIVIFDVSGSMDSNLNGQTRLQRAKTAVNTLAQKMLTGDKAGLVKMALISFSDTATLEQALTTNYSTYTSKVNSLQSGGGTNWEGALALANSLDVDQDAATFVVFVTDGDPTVRMSRGNVNDQGLNSTSNNTDNWDVDDGDEYYVRYGIYGSGYHDNFGRNYDFAVDAVSAIKNKNKNFYAIGVSSDVTKVRNLVTEAGISADNAFLATNSTALDNAFDSIASSINAALGFGSVSITDGITNLTNAEMKVMQDVDPDSFKYYRWGGENNKYGADEAHKTEWTTREADGCGAATYENGAVKWNMGDTFQLEDGVTYIVEFTVWPKQEAYDLVADLNNGVKVYDEGSDNSITAAERAQIVEIVKSDGTKTYALKTNTEEVSATYKKTTKSGDVVSTTDTVPTIATYHEGDIENMDLESELLTVKKTFEDDLTSGSDRMTSVTLKLKRRVTDTGEYVDYQIPINGTMTSDIVLNDSNNWQVQFYVAPGFKSSTNTNINEPGYQFTVTEPGIDYHYDLVEEVINPMLIDGTLQWIGDTDGNTALTAINRVKSGIDVQKLVYDTDGTTLIYPDTEFTITGRLLDKNGDPYTWSAGDSEDASGAYDIFVPDTTSSYHYPEHPYTLNGVQYDTYNRTQHKLHFANTNSFSFTLKAGEFLRFINVPEGTTFEFTESTAGMDTLGYQWSATDVITQHRVSAGGDFITEGDVQPTKSGQTATLVSPGVVGNKEYSVTYKNVRTVPLPEVELVKVDKEDTTQKLNDAEFKLYDGDRNVDGTKEVTADGNGNSISIKTGNKNGSSGPDGWYSIGTLPAGTYYLYETKAPANHELNEIPVIITVTKNGSAYTVSATQDGTNVLTGTGPYTITVQDERSTKWVQFKKVDMSSNPLGKAQFDFNNGTETVRITSYDPGTTKDENDVSGLMNTNDTYTFELVMSDNPYTLTEKVAPAGYNMLTEVVNVRVQANGVTAMSTSGETTYRVTYDESEGAAAPGTEENPYVVSITNSNGVELPHTGGSGTLIYTLSGLMLLIASALMYGFRMRRRERRLN